MEIRVRHEAVEFRCFLRRYTVALVPVERVSQEVLTVQSSRTIEYEGTRDDRIVRCDEEIEMGVILLILFIAVVLAVHEGMLHRFGSPYR